jgi:hypothetical protein
VLIWVGALMTALGTVLFVIGFVVVGAKAFDTFDEGLDPESKLDLTVEVPGEGSVRLEPDRYQLVALGPTLTRTSGRQSDAGGLRVDRLPFAEPTMTVTDPDGKEVALEPPSIDRLANAPGLDSVGLSEFTVTTAGEYTLEVEGEPDAVTKVGVGEAKGLWEEASGWVAGAIVIAVGALLVTVGIMVLVAGFIWWVFSRTAARAAWSGLA